MKKTCLITVIILLFMCATAFSDDSFSRAVIDATRWRDVEDVRMHNPDEGNLQIAVRAVNPNQRNRSHFYFPDSEAIYSVRTDVVIRSVNVHQNTNNDARAEARINGYFYSTKSSPTGVGGNVWAGVLLSDYGAGLEAQWAVEMTENDQGTNFAELGSGVLVSQGTLHVDTPYILELEYDPTNREFRFAIYDSTGALLGSDQQAFANRAGPAYDPFLSITGIAYNDSAYIDATFDNIYVKTSPSGNYQLYDDCSTFDPTKWDSTQFARKIEGGQLFSAVQSTGDQETNDLRFIDNPDYIESRVIVSSRSSIPTGGRGQARINGYYFNDTVPPSQQSGYAGNVWAHVLMQANGNSLTASCYVGKSLNDDESQWEDIWSSSFNDFLFSYDTPFTLSIEFTGSAFNFKISDGASSTTHTYNLPSGTTVYDAYNEFRSLRTRVYGDAGGGTLFATFDNVRTAPLAEGWETISGSVAYNGTPVCAMVLANGQYLFTCQPGDDFGKYVLDVPLDKKGEITVQAFVSGLSPFRMTTDTSDLNMDIAMQPASLQSKSPAVTTVIASNAATPAGRARITGTVALADGTPLCAMVLANGQYMFSCNANNGIYDLTVPLDSKGEITQFVFVSGLQPYRHTFAP